MNLLSIVGRRCRVLFTEQVLTELSDWGSAKEPKAAMVSLMTRSVPEYGPPFGTPACTPMGDGLFEFRKGQHRGPKVRVLWFYGDNTDSDVVCVRAFVKTVPKTPPEEIAAANAARELYANATKGKTLHIEDGSDLLRKKGAR
jgi:phage-related protein